MDLSTVSDAPDAIPLERIDDARYLPMSARPSWWEACVKQERGGDEPVVISDVFPFLEVFLREAERAWSKRGVSTARSELWTTNTADGRELHLEAVAKLVGGCAVLVV